MGSSLGLSNCLGHEGQAVQHISFPGTSTRVQVTLHTKSCVSCGPVAVPVHVTGTLAWAFLGGCLLDSGHIQLGVWEVELCSRSLRRTSVVSRRLLSFVVVVASQICCHWGKLLQVTFHGCVMCQFARLFHCDLHDADISRKKRDAFRCTGAAFCEIRSLLRSAIGISVLGSRVFGVGCGRAIGICVLGCGAEALFS